MLRVAGKRVSLDQAKLALLCVGPEFQHASEFANGIGILILAQQAVPQEDVRRVILRIGADDVAKPPFCTAAITGSECLLRLAHLLTDIGRLRQRAGGEEKEKQSV